MQGAILGRGVVVGEDAVVERGCLVADGVVLGPKARLGPFMRVSVRPRPGEGKKGLSAEEEEDDEEDDEEEDDDEDDEEAEMLERVIAGELHPLSFFRLLIRNFPLQHKQQTSEPASAPDPTASSGPNL